MWKYSLNKYALLRTFHDYCSLVTFRTNWCTNIKVNKALLVYRNWSLYRLREREKLQSKSQPAGRFIKTQVSPVFRLLSEQFSLILLYVMVEFLTIMIIKLEGKLLLKVLLAR